MCRVQKVSHGKFMACCSSCARISELICMYWSNRLALPLRRIHIARLQRWYIYVHSPQGIRILEQEAPTWLLEDAVRHLPCALTPYWECREPPVGCRGSPRGTGRLQSTELRDWGLSEPKSGILKWIDGLWASRPSTGVFFFERMDTGPACQGQGCFEVSNIEAPCLRRCHLAHRTRYIP